MSTYNGENRMVLAECGPEYEGEEEEEEEESIYNNNLANFMDLVKECEERWENVRDEINVNNK